MEGSEQITPFDYKEMDTYFSLNRFNSWAPDSYYKELLIETNECYFNFYELNLINSFLLKEKK
ncbi:hypothetical protein C9994_03985 [Marivirga lumbricoides]|uniref:Uncharacterized protein n=1 Tax=Marivirga lumbricoides TaxID=1046115 RepID=A0A2T4DU22_9BACT|nr:hypothetical protein C9994_03985 [Marivirga lumbricoides]